MKSMIRLSAACAVLLGLAIAQAKAQESASGTLVAVIDLDYVFSKHTAFTQQLDRLKEEHKKLEEDRKGLVTRLDGLRKELSGLKPGSPDYKALEQDLAEQVAKAQVDTELRMKDLSDKQARLHYDEYMRVLREVDAVAQKNGIGLVLRFERDAIDATDRNSVLRGVNRTVVFQRELDITELVLKGLSVPERLGDRPDRPATGTRKKTN